MIVHTPNGRILLVAHAVHRFRQRVGVSSDRELVAAIQRAKLRLVPPSWASARSAREHAHEAWLVGTGWACPLRTPRVDDRNAELFDFAAITCITKDRARSKAEVRAWRAQSREEWAA